jgi:molybdenum cofactor cytidylyltransferase
VGSKVDLDLVRAGAVLHDLAKGQRDHAGAGGRLLLEMGFGKTGKVVAAHSDLPDGLTGSSLEAKIVFLADKFVSGENLVSIEQRYAQALERFGADNQIKAGILLRKETALSVKREFEAVLGYPLELIINKQ